MLSFCQRQESLLSIFFLQSSLSICGNLTMENEDVIILLVTMAESMMCGMSKKNSKDEEEEETCF